MATEEIDIYDLEMPASIVFTMLNVATMLELPINKIINHFSIDIEAILNAESANIAKFETLMESLITLSPKKDFHLHFAQAFTFAHNEGLEMLIVNNSTGQEAIQDIFRYKELFMPLCDMQIENRVDNDLIIYASNTQHPISDKYYYAEILFVVSLVFGYRLLNKESMVEKIAFRHKRPVHHQQLSQLFNCPIVYEHSKDIAWVKKGVLQSTFKTNQPALYKTARELLEARLKKISADPGLINQLEVYIYNHLNDEQLNIQSASAALSISSRKLQRLLQEKNTSFSHLKTHIRITTAKALLKNTQRPLSEISELLGFSDVSSFSRFFSKIENCSPSTYRKQSLL